MLVGDSIPEAVLHARLFPFISLFNINGSQTSRSAVASKSTGLFMNIFDILFVY